MYRIKKAEQNGRQCRKTLREESALTDEQIVRLAQYGVKIENHYGGPQDIEWAMDDRGEIFILQVRPETVYGAEKEVKAEETKGSLWKKIYSSKELV